MYAAVVWSPGLVSVGDSSVGEFDGQEILTVSGVFFDFRDDLTPVQSFPNYFFVLSMKHAAGATASEI